MKNREVILWTVIIALIGGGVLFFSLNVNNPSTKDIRNINVSANIQTKQISNSDSSNNPKSVTTNIELPQSYSLTDVSKHNNRASCWTIINGNIYDITSFISSHPAGVQKILQGCGIDATRVYGRVGAHDVSKLSNFIVGSLK